MKATMIKTKTVTPQTRAHMVLFVRKAKRVLRMQTTGTGKSIYTKSVSPCWMTPTSFKVRVSMEAVPNVSKSLDENWRERS